MAIHSRTTKRTIQAAINDRAPFKSPATLSAETADYIGFMGALPIEHRDTLRNHAASGPIYIVRSYATPIAWHTDEHGWCIPDTRYSPTTTGHQYAIRSAIAGILA